MTFSPINLPLTPEPWPHFRVLTRATFGAGIAPGGPDGGGWQVRTMQGDGPTSSGLVLLNYSRALLPQFGTARLAYRFGQFVSRINGASPGSPTPGESWDPETDAMGEIPDLTGMEIRIQASRGYYDSEDYQWATVWWGTCEYQVDEGWGGADVPSGERIYHCVDALHRLKRWPLQEHGFAGAGVARGKGHPGYNVAPGAPSQIAGNRDSTGATWVTQSGATALYHTRPGAGTTWSDEQAINNALAISRPTGEPYFVLGGDVDQFSDPSAVNVEEGSNAWDFLVQMCARGRGRGAIALEWTEGSADGPLSPVLRVYAQLESDITYTVPSGGSASIPGATSNGTAVDVTVIGDHRFVAQSLSLGDAQQFQVGYLESLGERIQTIATVSYEDVTLVAGWNATSKTAFNAITDPLLRTDQKWAPVYQLHRLSRTFAFTAGNGSGSGHARCDYQCTDAGAIVAGTTPETSVLTATVMDDLPLYEGYKYDTTPVREDGDSAVTFAGTPARRAPLMWARNSDGNFIPFAAMSQPIAVKIMPDGFLIEVANNQETGLRYFADSDGVDTQKVYNYTQIGMTIGFELPHRIRLATGKPDARRRMTIMHPGIHLWVAHQGAIWDFDSPNRDGAYIPAKRACAASTTGFPGILRDDRNALARLHYLAVSWYGPRTAGVDPDPRRNASWSLRCCGDIPTADDYDGGSVVYPAVGEVVKYLYANGQKISLRTPVSSFVYDNESGISTWTTDWQDLDFVR